MRDGKLHKKLVVVIEAGLKAFDFGSEVRVRKQLGGLCGKFESLGMFKLEAVWCVCFEIKCRALPKKLRWFYGRCKSLWQGSAITC